MPANQKKYSSNHGLLWEAQQRLRELSKKKDSSKRATTGEVAVRIANLLADTLIAVRSD